MNCTKCLFSLDDLNSVHKCLGFYILEIFNGENNGEYWTDDALVIPNLHLASRTGLNTRNITRHLKTLSEHSFITQNTRGKGSSPSYELDYEFVLNWLGKYRTRGHKVPYERTSVPYERTDQYRTRGHKVPYERTSSTVREDRSHPYTENFKHNAEQQNGVYGDGEQEYSRPFEPINEADKWGQDLNHEFAGYEPYLFLPDLRQVMVEFQAMGIEYREIVRWLDKARKIKKLPDFQALPWIYLQVTGTEVEYGNYSFMTALGETDE